MCSEKHQHLEGFFGVVVPRPGIEPGLAAAANADHPEQRNANEIRLLRDLDMFRLVPFCSDL